MYVTVTSVCTRASIIYGGGLAAIMICSVKSWLFDGAEKGAAGWEMTDSMERREKRSLPRSRSGDLAGLIAVDCHCF